MTASALTAPARAEVSEVKLVAQNGSNYLPLFVMQGQQLVEKRLAEKGLSATQVTWAKLANPSVIIDGFLSGNVHFSGQGVPSTALIWDRTRNSIGVKAVSAMVASNIKMMCKDPAVKSVADLTDKHRIAIPSIRSSAQALFLWLAAEKTFGPGQFAKLDHLAVSLPHPEAMAAVINPVSEITVHAATPPFSDIERKAGLRAIADLYSVIGGPMTGLNFVSTEQFRKENPKTYEAVVAAYNEALAWINADKKRAGRFYLDIAKEKMTIDEFSEIMLDPDYLFDAVPRGIGLAMDMMHKTGGVKTKVTSWKDIYFPEAHNLPGN